MEDDEMILNALDKNPIIRPQGITRPSSVKPQTQNTSGFVVNEAGASSRRKQVLERIKDLSDKDAVQMLLSGKMQISDKVLYAVLACDGSDAKVIDSAKPREIGITNFTNGRYKHHFLLQKVAILYNDGLNAKTGRYDKVLPAEIANGVFKILNDSRTLLDEFPVERLATKNTKPLQDGYNEIELDNPKWLVKEKDNAFEIDFSGSITVGFVKILLIGQEIRPY